MPEDIKPTQPTATPAAAPSQPAAKTSALPAEYQGKSADEIYSALSDRYKDYDSYKEKAGVADRWSSLKADPESYTKQQKWISDLLGPLSQGKQAVFNQKSGRIEFIDTKGNATPATPQQQQDYFENWETLDGHQQGERMTSLVDDHLNSKVQEVVQRYDQQFGEAVQRMNQQSNLFIDVLQKWIDNPSLNPRDILAKITEYQQGGNVLDLATRDLMTPQQIEQKASEMAAAKIADFQAKWEREHAAPTLSAPTARPRGITNNNGEKLKGTAFRDQVIQSWRERNLVH